jgi:hypothetical protein
MAAKLARLLYRMLRYGMQCVDRGAKFYAAQHRNLQIAHLKRKPPSWGFESLNWQLKAPFLESNP